MNTFHLFAGLVAHEWRRLRRSPAWLIGFFCAGLLGFMETEVSGALGYPSPGQALYGFQVAASVVLPLLAFLLAAGSVASDLEPSREALIFSRPVSKHGFVLAKLVGCSSFCLTLAVLLSLGGILTPVFHGAWTVHSPADFLLVLGLCCLPAILFASALGIFLTAIVGRVIVAFPVFLIYFFAVALLPAGGNQGNIRLADFTQRLFPRELVIEVPLRLTEVSFAGLLHPISAEVLLRSGLYMAFAAAIAGLAGTMLEGQRRQRFSAWMKGVSARLFTRRSGPEVNSFSGTPVAQGSRPWMRTAGGSGSAAGAEWLRSELFLLLCSARMLLGRNLVATGMTAAGIVISILTYTVGDFQSRQGVLMMQIEMFAPLFGVIMFSDLVAMEFEARRADLLRLSSRGAAWVVGRKLLHGLLFAGLACGLLLLVLRVVYTRFDLLQAFGVVIPGVLYFGMVGLLAASISRRSLVGYTAGTAAMLLSMIVKQVEPLTPTSFLARTHLANGRLLDEGNWIMAKVVLLIFALLLVVTVLRIIYRPEAWKRAAATTALVVIGSHAGLHWLWSEPGPKAAVGPEITREWTLGEQAEEKLTRRLAVTRTGKEDALVESSLLLDVRSAKSGDEWKVRSEQPTDLTSEFVIRHLDLEVSVSPTDARFHVDARFHLMAMLPDRDRLLFYLAAEMQVSELFLNGARVDFTKTADLVEIPLNAATEQGQGFELRLVYSGKLRPGSNLKFERAREDFLFVSSRWFPALHRWGSNSRCLFTCRALVRVPEDYALAAGTLQGREPGSKRYLWETQTPVDSVPLFIGKFREFHGEYEGIPLTFCSFTVDEAYAERILKHAGEVLRELQQAFGLFPYPRLAIVENSAQGAGGAAFPGLITMKPDRLAPEHERRFLDGYLPHEIAHSWWCGPLPPWVAEGAAVFANIHYLESTRGTRAAAEFLDKEFYERFFTAGAAPQPLIATDGVALYTRGGYLPKMLATVSGKEGLLSEMRQYLAQQFTENRVDRQQAGEAYLQALARVVGREWEGFVEDWVKSTKRFDPAVVGVREERTAGGYHLALDLQHLGELRFPVPVRLTLADGIRDLVWATKEDGGKLELETESPLVSVELDPDHKLLDWNRSNNEGTPGLARSVAHTRAAHRGWKTYSVNDGLPGPDVTWMSRGTNGCIYASIRSLQLAMNREWAVVRFNGKWELYRPEIEPVLLANALVQQADGTLWFASQNQLRRVCGQDSKKVLLNEKSTGKVIGARSFVTNTFSGSPVPGSRIYCLLVDREDRIWVGTDHGLTSITGEFDSVRTWDALSGLTATEIFALAQDKFGTLWAGTEKGLYSFDGKGWTPQPGFPRDLVLCLSAGPDGILWCGTYWSGLWSVKAGVVRQHFNPGGRETIISSVAAGAGESAWVGTPEGLFHLQGSEWSAFNRANSGLPSHKIRCLLVDDTGAVWVATDAGVSRFDPAEGQGSLPTLARIP